MNSAIFEIRTAAAARVAEFGLERPSEEVHSLWFPVKAGPAVDLGLFEGMILIKKYPRI